MPIEEIEKGGLWNNILHHLYPGGAPRALPGIIIAGDGHGNSAGGMCHSWAGGAADYLREHVRANRVCLHMEIHQDQVPGVPLPPALEGARGKTFGFEMGALRKAPDVVEVLSAITQTSAALNGPSDAYLFDGIIDNICKATADLSNISTNFLMLDGEFNVGGIFDILSVEARDIAQILLTISDYFTNLRNSLKMNAPVTFSEFEGRNTILKNTCLNALQNIGGSWRDQLNPIFARKISQKIAMYPTDLHIVSIGDAHLSAHPGSGNVYLLPMQKFIRRSENMWGILDRSQGLGMR